MVFPGGDNGVVSCADERGLELITLEQRVKRDERRAALTGAKAPAKDESASPSLGLGGTQFPTAELAVTKRPISAPEQVQASPPAATPMTRQVPATEEARAEDPGKGGHKLDLLRR
jgi:hypothetical protein